VDMHEIRETLISC